MTRLEITIPDVAVGVLFVLCFFFVIMYIITENKRLKLSRKFNEMLGQKMEEFMQHELKNKVDYERKLIQQEFDISLMLLKAQMENKLVVDKQIWRKHERAQAIAQSDSVYAGKWAEHFIPFFEEFVDKDDLPLLPADARFIGTPIDLLVFAGMSANEEISIYFYEVKTGKSRVTDRQKSVKDAIDKGRVYWKEVRLTTN